MKIGRLAMVAGGAFLIGNADAAEREWDQGRAKKMISQVVDVEKKESQPWNRIPWRTSVDRAVKEAKETGKPIFVFLYLEQSDPPPEGCCLEGRLLRTHVLADSTVLSLVKGNCVPVKLKVAAGKGFPVDWPALSRWATAFKIAGENGFAGCSVVSSDLLVEYGNSGSARLWELFDSRAYNPKSFAAMLETAEARLTEERSLGVQRGISGYERALEMHQFRRGLQKAVRSEHNSRLPPKGYSLEQVVELRKMAGPVAEPPAKK